MNIKDKVKSMYHGWKNYLIPNYELEPLFKDRLEICSTCPKNKAGICTLCGCVLEAKTRSLEEECPAGKWNPKLRQDGDALFRLKHELPNSFHAIFDGPVIPEEEWQQFIKDNEGL